MTPIVFINTKDIPFVDMIITEQKLFETRNRNTLGGLVGRRVLLAETGHGKPIVRCATTIARATRIDAKEWWDFMFRESSCIPKGSKYDWNEKTKYKWLYTFGYVEPLNPFNPPEGKRHGRVWMEYEEV